jgi:hypothetical protein
MEKQSVVVDVEDAQEIDDGSKNAVIAHMGIADIIVSLDKEPDGTYHWCVGNLLTGVSGQTMRGAVRAAVKQWGEAFEPAMNHATGPTMIEVEPENLGQIATLLSFIPSELLPDVARLLAKEMADAGVEMSSQTAAA